MSALCPQFQINMQRKMRFTGIVTQGASRIGTAEFIKAFKVASSLDGRTYTMYRTEGQRKDNVRTQYIMQQKSVLNICFEIIYFFLGHAEKCAHQDTSIFNTQLMSLCF